MITRRGGILARCAPSERFDGPAGTNSLLTIAAREIIFALQSKRRREAHVMELREALSHIAEIRSRMAEAEVFRGYRALPVAGSGLLAVMAAIVQPYWVPDPGRDVMPYCALWVGVAAISIAAAALTMLVRDRFGRASQTRDVTLLAVSQLAPSLAAGALVSAVIIRRLPEAVGLLPGLWQVLLALGLFASCRLLPRATAWVGLFYLLSGAAVLALARDGWLLHPWAMGLPFGVGQLSAAAVLYWNLERGHEET